MYMGFDFTRLFRWLISKKEQKESTMPAAENVQRADSRGERVNFSGGSRRDQDMSAEAELARFIDEYLYAVLAVMLPGSDLSLPQMQTFDSNFLGPCFIII